MSRTFVAHVNPTPGLLARVDALFRRQDAELTSLSYDLAHRGGASLTIVASASEEAARLLAKHLARLADVREVETR